MKKALLLSVVLLTGCEYFCKDYVQVTTAPDAKQIVKLALPKPAPLDLTTYKFDHDFVVVNQNGTPYLALPVGKYDKVSELMKVLQDRIYLLQQQNDQYRSYYEKP